MKNLNLNAETLANAPRLGVHLSICGAGPNAFLWIGSEQRGMIGVAYNTRATRAFLRRALARMERLGGRRRGN